MNIISRRIERLPPYVFAEVNAHKMELRRRGVDIIDLGMGNPDQPTPGHIVDKLKEVAGDPKSHRYAPSQGMPALRRAIARHYKRRFDVTIDPDTDAIVTIGSKEGLAHICLAMLDPGDLAIVPNPAYPLHLYGEIEFLGAGISLDTLTVGVGYNSALGDRTDLYLRARYVDAEAEALGLSIGEDGFSVAAGLRFMAAERLELGAAVRHLDLGGSDTGLVAQAIYYATDQIGLGAGMAASDESTALSLGLRFQL